MKLNKLLDGSFIKKMRNQFELKAEVEQIKSPKYKIYNFRDFDLSKIPSHFKIADFERAKSTHHINEIKIAIVNNQFFDNVIRTVVKGSKTIVIDGQHRLGALYMLYKDHGLAKYDLVVIEYAEDHQRTVYRKLNVGKKLSLANHLKALDNGRIQFFNELKDILCHDDNSKLWTYKEALECHTYAITEQTLSIRRIEQALVEANEADLNYIRTFAESLIMTSPTKTRGIQFRKQFVINAYSISYKRDYNKAEIVKLISLAMKNDKVIDLTMAYSSGESRKALREEFEKIGATIR